MGNILMTGSGGGGAGSDDCTATAAELLKGYTGILKGSDDEPVQGTLELTGNAQAAHVLNGETFYTNNAKSKQTGTMPNRGDYNGWGNSKGNDAGNQRMWVKVPSGYYNENANVFLSWEDIRNMAGITPEKIKKNEPIMGIIGSFQGWVGDAGDLYINGANNAGFIAVTGAGFLQDRITLGGTSVAIEASKSYTITTSQRLYIQGNINASFGAGQSGSKYIQLKDTISGSTLDSIKIGDVSINNGFSFSVGRNVTFAPKIIFPYAANNWGGYITRIYIA